MSNTADSPGRSIVYELSDGRWAVIPPRGENGDRAFDTRAEATAYAAGWATAWAAANNDKRTDR